MQLLSATKGWSLSVILILHLKMFCVRNMNMTTNQNHQQSHNITKKSFENVWKCKYLETKLMNRSEVCDEIRRRVNSGNVYCLVQKLLLSHLFLWDAEDQIIQNNSASCFVCVWRLLLWENPNYRYWKT